MLSFSFFVSVLQLNSIPADKTKIEESDLVTYYMDSLSVSTNLEFLRIEFNICHKTCNYPFIVQCTCTSQNIPQLDRVDKEILPLVSLLPLFIV